MPGNVQAGGAEAVAHIAGDIDADEVERNTLGAGPLQGGQPMADLLEAGTETVLQALQVVPRRAAAWRNGCVGHDQGAGHITAKSPPVQIGFGGRHVTGLGQPRLDRRPAGQERQRRATRKTPAFLGQPSRE